MVPVAEDEVVSAGNIDFSEMRAALCAVGAAFASLVHEVSEEDAARKAPHLTWTVAETAAHMLTILKRGTGDRRRADSLAGLAELNDLAIAEVPTRHPAELAAAIAAESAALDALLDAIDAEIARSTVVKLHSHVRTDIPSALSYVLFDLLVHGYDIALATGAPWGIDRRHAALDLHACLPIFGPWARREVTGGSPDRLIMTFPEDPDAIVIDIGDSSYRAQNYPLAEVAGEAAEVDVVDALLALSGRRPATTPAVARLASFFEPI